MARLLSLSTLAIASGKLVLGPIIDHYGGILSLKAALSALAVLMGIISVSSSFGVFAGCWVFVDFIFSSCWAGCINAIHQSFPEREWAKRIGMLAAAARTGNAAAFAFFAWLLHASGGMAQPWRAVFATSAMLQVVPIALLSYCERDTNLAVSEDTSGIKGKKKLTLEQIRSKTSMKDSLATLRREAAKPEFWLHLLSRSVLMVYASFLLFVPTLMSKVYGATPSFAAQVGSIYALGCLLSVTLGSNLYANLRRNQKISAVVSLLGMSTASSIAQLGHMQGLWQLSQNISAALLFLWGFSFAIPFYIPPSLYALARGGMKSSATIADGTFTTIYFTLFVAVILLFFFS
jgi:MFS family permease